MTSDDLQPAQAERLKQQADAIQRWARRLVARCDALRFPPNDPVRVAAQQVKNSALSLSTAAWYAAAPEGQVARGA